MMSGTRSNVQVSILHILDSRVLIADLTGSPDAACCRLLVKAPGQRMLSLFKNGSWVQSYQTHPLQST